MVKRKKSEHMLESYVPFPTSLCPIFVGYTELEDLVLVADPTQPVYAYLRVEYENFYEVEDKRVERHVIIVGQPDGLNRVHYCPVRVVELVYINNAPFDPDHAAKLEAVQATYEKLIAWLEVDLIVKRGMVAMPVGLWHVTGSLPRALQQG